MALARCKSSNGGLKIEKLNFVHFYAMVSPWQWLTLGFLDFPEHRQFRKHVRRLLGPRLKTQIEGLFVGQPIS